MITFAQYLIEIGNRPQSYTWTRRADDLLHAEFTTSGGKRYRVTFLKSKGKLPNAVYPDRPSWTVEFSLYKNGQQRIDATGTGESVQVFGTVLEILKDFITDKRPKQFYFSSDIHEPTRTKLYAKFAEMSAKFLPSEWKPAKRRPSGHHDPEFWFYR